MLFPNCTGYSSVFKLYRFKICRQKIYRFRVNWRPIRHIFHRLQKVPASCERCLSFLNLSDFRIFRVSYGYVKGSITVYMFNSSALVHNSERSPSKPSQRLDIIQVPCVTLCDMMPQTSENEIKICRGFLD